MNTTAHTVNVTQLVDVPLRLTPEDIRKRLERQQELEARKRGPFANVYGQLILLGFNGHLIDGETTAQRRSKLTLTRRAEANGRVLRRWYWKKGRRPPRANSSSGSVEHDFIENDDFTIEYTTATNYDAFSVGRSTFRNDLIVDSALSYDRLINQHLRYKTSRYAFRLMCDRNNPDNVYIYAGGLDLENQIVLGRKSHCYTDEEDNIDALLPYGILICNPTGTYGTTSGRYGHWKEVSVMGKLYSYSKDSHYRELYPYGRNQLIDGTLIHLGGAVLMWRSASGLAEQRITLAHIHELVKSINEANLRCGHYPLVLPMLDPMLEPDDCEDPVPYVYTACGHIISLPRERELPYVGTFICHECKEAGSKLVRLRIGLEPAIYVGGCAPTHCFAPCGHVASSNTVRDWCSHTMVNFEGDDYYMCPFCGSPVERRIALILMGSLIDPGPDYLNTEGYTPIELHSPPAGAIASVATTTTVRAKAAVAVRSGVDIKDIISKPLSDIVEVSENDSSTPSIKSIPRAARPALEERLKGKSADDDDIYVELIEPRVDDSDVYVELAPPPRPPKPANLMVPVKTAKETVPKAAEPQSPMASLYELEDRAFKEMNMSEDIIDSMDVVELKDKAPVQPTSQPKAVTPPKDNCVTQTRPSVGYQEYIGRAVDNTGETYKIERHTLQAEIHAPPRAAKPREDYYNLVASRASSSLPSRSSSKEETSSDRTGTRPKIGYSEETLATEVNTSDLTSSQALTDKSLDDIEPLPSDDMATPPLSRRFSESFRKIFRKKKTTPPTAKKLDDSMRDSESDLNNSTLDESRTKSPIRNLFRSTGALFQKSKDKAELNESTESKLYNSLNTSVDENELTINSPNEEEQAKEGTGFKQLIQGRSLFRKKNKQQQENEPVNGQQHAATKAKNDEAANDNGAADRSLESEKTTASLSRKMGAFWSKNLSAKSKDDDKEEQKPKNKSKKDSPANAGKTNGRDKEAGASSLSALKDLKIADTSKDEDKQSPDKKRNFNASFEKIRRSIFGRRSGGSNHEVEASDPTKIEKDDGVDLEDRTGEALPTSDDQAGYLIVEASFSKEDPLTPEKKGKNKNSNETSA